MNPVIDSLRKRRSIRKYQERQVPKEIIDSLLATAVMSPSAVNRQPWRFTVIEDKKRIAQLSGKVKKQLGLLGYAVELDGRLASKEDTIFYNAPLLIIVSAEKGDKWNGINCGILAQTMFLAAYSLGLGSCYIGFANTLNNDPEALKELGIPESSEIIAPMIFGYPAEEKSAPRREARILKWLK